MTDQVQTTCDHDAWEACDACASCIESSDECSGPVERRWPGYGHKRCEKHGQDCLARQELIEQRYRFLRGEEHRRSDNPATLHDAYNEGPLLTCEDDGDRRFKGAELEPRTDNVKVEPPSIRAAAQMAIDCQDACNGSGVALTLAKQIFPAVWGESRRRGNLGTDWVNKHPIVYLFLHKLIDLSGPSQSGFLEFSKQYDLVKRIAAGEEGV